MFLFHTRLKLFLLSTFSIACLLVSFSLAWGVQGPLKVVATVPEQGSLVKILGGDQVSVEVMGKGWEDPHFVLPKPSFVKILNKADLFVQTGLELEIGWAPALVQQARNPKILMRRPGFFDSSFYIEPLEVYVGDVDRSMGDVHPYGNPHYMIDPLMGLQVARQLTKKLIELKPDQKDYFQKRFQNFYRQIGVGLVGEALFKKYDFEKLAKLHEHGKLKGFLEKQGDLSSLQGWLGQLLPFFGSKLVDDHNMWVYFSRCFGVKVVGHLEPKPGIPPTTRHLRDLVKLMKAEEVKIVIASPYYDPRYAKFIREKTGAKIVELAHQVNARKGTEDYLKMMDYNVRTLEKNLASIQ